VGASPAAAQAELEEERSKVREAQLHAEGMKRSFDALLSEMERLKADPLSDAFGGSSRAFAPTPGGLRAPELLRPVSAAGGEPSFAVAVARCVLAGYSAEQAENVLREIGRNDAAAAVARLRVLGANPETDPPTAARLGGVSRAYSPYPFGPVTFPKGRPPAAAGAAAWPGRGGKVRPGVRGDIFSARRRAAQILVAVTGRAYAENVATSPEMARDRCLAALGGLKILATRRVGARLLLASGGLEACAAALAVYRRDASVVCAAAAVLRELCAGESSAGAVAASSKLPAVLLASCAALKSNRGCAPVAIHAAALCWSLFSLGGRPLQSLACDCGAP